VERLAFKVLVPARMRSTRLPGKMLADVAGKPLVAWAAQRGAESGAEEVIVATDHQDIADAVAAHGWRVCMTSASHETGTDRLAEAVALLGLQPGEIVVNVQGDEPLLDPKLIRKVAAQLALRPGAAIATAVHPIANAAAFFDPNVVKVVIDTEGYAQYFSRAPIPFARDAFANTRASRPRPRSASRRSSSCARWAMAIASPSPSGTRRWRRGSTLPRTWKGRGASSATPYNRRLHTETTLGGFECG
jgi:3-deoxy-manno-octulosonate cytidylyltransferase (CMP-KDO synthetase)